MTQAPELKPCPFCGGEAEHLKDHTTEECDSIQCVNWCVWVSDYDEKGSCITAWNTRATDARIAELEEALDQIQGMGFDMPMTLDLSELAWSKRRAGTMQHIARTALQKEGE